MGIAVKDPDSGTPYSTGDMSNPITTLLNGTDGDAFDIPLMLQSDDNTLEYHSVTITMEHPHARIAYKFALDIDGVPGEYSDVLEIDKIDINGVKIWMRKEVLPNTPTELYRDAKIKITATELAVQ